MKKIESFVKNTNNGDHIKGYTYHPAYLTDSNNVVYGYIEDINVIDRRNGIGTKLINEIIEWLKSKSATKVFIDIVPYDSTNMKDIKNFYKKNCFKIMGEEGFRDI